MDGNDMKGRGARFLLQPQEVRLCAGPDLLPERAPTARNNPLTEESLTHSFNRTIMVSWLPNCPFKIRMNLFFFLKFEF